MTPADLVARLRTHRTIGQAPEAELEWIAHHGEFVRFNEGEIVTRREGAIFALWILLEGHISIRIDRGTGARKVMEWHGGDVTGLLPYSRMTAAPGESSAEAPSEMIRVDRKHFPELITRCPEITAMLVHVMVDRARLFTSTDLHAEKMLSLGRLAAGLAHELNNPASAVVRGAKALLVRLEEAETAARDLGAAGLPAGALEAVDRIRATHWTDAATSARSPIDRADREDAIEAWLRARHVALDDAEPLARSSITIEELDTLAREVGTAGLLAAMRVIATSRSIHHLAWEIETAASRIHGLVSAVKGFTRLDQAAAPVPFDITQSLRDTVAVLSAKARSKDVKVTLDVPDGLPKVNGVAGELNQVWSNLIDNALDAVPVGGHIEVMVRARDGCVDVCVTDDGPGIPKEVQPRLFDPFYTTKPLGQGTGLGLDIARRLVRRHDGHIEFETRPGRTMFRVRLPGVVPA